jgi:hypothetical protein
VFVDLARGREFDLDWLVVGEEVRRDRPVTGDPWRFIPLA